MSRIRLAALVVAGPTAALVYGAVNCARAGRWAMAAVYALGAVEMWLVLPATLAGAIQLLH